MNPLDMLRVVDELIGGAEEAFWRSAISRIYYAAFHVARGLLLSCGFAVPLDQRAHAYLWRRLSHSGHPDVAAAGATLWRLRRDRNGADYHLDRPVSHDLAVRDYELALDGIRLLQAAAVDPVVRPRITQTIKTYERDVLLEVTWRPLTP